MIVVLRRGASEKQKKHLSQWFEEQGLRVNASESPERTVLCIIGDTSRVDAERVAGFDGVERVQRVTEVNKCSGRQFHPEDTVVEVGSVKIGGGHFAVMAGPCSVESEEQVVAIARAVKAAGADVLRGGAYKPRTSPYDFQGTKELGLEWLKIARKESGLPIVTEVMGVKELELFEDIDILQIGARNMQNYDLLKEIGRLRKPVLLKRGPAAGLREWLLSAEYLMAEGNTQVILCERGIRSFGDYTRNLLDLAAVPLMHEMTHLPVIVDPSHATGISRLVPPMAAAAVSAGADGLMIEVHNDPQNALCDGGESITPDQFETLMRKVKALRDIR